MEEEEKKTYIWSDCTEEEKRRALIWAQLIGCDEGELMNFFLNNLEAEYERFKLMIARWHREVDSIR